MSTMLRWTEEQLAEHKAKQAAAPAPLASVAAPAPEKPVTPLQRLQALGRLKSGDMNKSEARYAEHLEAERIAGRIRWWKFEGITLKLAKDLRLTIDFAVMTADCVLEMRDVKGSNGVFMDDARAKTKMAAELFPFVFKVVVPVTKKNGGGWHEETIGE